MTDHSRVGGPIPFVYGSTPCKNLVVLGLFNPNNVKINWAFYCFLYTDTDRYQPPESGSFHDLNYRESWSDVRLSLATRTDE